MSAPADDRVALAAEFHRHLDSCRRCRERPMDLCPKGAELLRKAAMS